MVSYGSRMRGSFLSLIFFTTPPRATPRRQSHRGTLKVAIFLEDSRNLWVNLKTVVEYACPADPGASQAF